MAVWLKQNSSFRSCRDRGALFTTKLTRDNSCRRWSDFAIVGLTRYPVLFPRLYLRIRSNCVTFSGPFFDRGQNISVEFLILYLVWWLVVAVEYSLFVF